MQDFEATTETAENHSEEKNGSSERFSTVLKQAFKKFVLFVSFGPGILGFLWLLGKILKR